MPHLTAASTGCTFLSAPVCSVAVFDPSATNPARLFTGFKTNNGLPGATVRGILQVVVDDQESNRVLLARQGERI